MKLPPALTSLSAKIRTSALWKRLMPPQDVGGLEITDDYLKLVYFDATSEGFRWKHFAARPLPAGIIVNGEVKNTEALSLEIRQLFDSIAPEKKLSGDVILTIPDTAVYLQKLSVPMIIDPLMVGAVILNNPTVVFPYPLNDVYISWQTVEIIGFERRIVVGIAKKSAIDAYQNAAERAGLIPIALQTSVFGLEMIGVFPAETVVLYFIEKNTFSTAVYINGKLALGRNDSFAEHIKKTPVEFADIADFIANDFMRMKDYLLAELGEKRTISLAIHSYYAGADQIAALLKAKNVPVQTLNFQKMKVPENIPNIAPWTGVLGASLRGAMQRKLDAYVSFLSFTPREQYVWRKKVSFFSRTMKLVFAALLFYMACFVGMAFFLSSVNTKTNTEFTRTQGISLPPELASLEGEKKNFNDAIVRVLEIKPQLISVLPAVKAVKNLASNGIALSNMSFQLGEKGIDFTLAGTASTREQLLVFKKYLEDQKVFKDIKIPVESLAQREGINFPITFTYAR